LVFTICISSDWAAVEACKTWWKAFNQKDYSGIGYLVDAYCIQISITFKKLVANYP